MSRPAMTPAKPTVVLCMVLALWWGLIGRVRAYRNECREQLLRGVLGTLVRGQFQVVRPLELEEAAAVTVVPTLDRRTPIGACDVAYDICGIAHLPANPRRDRRAGLHRPDFAGQTGELVVQREHVRKMNVAAEDQVRARGGPLAYR